MFVIHHIACDGWSLPVLTSDFTTLYGAFAQGMANPLPTLDYQYVDYAVWQRESLFKDFGPTERYWEDKLTGMPQMHGLPLDKRRPAVSSGRGGVVECVLDASVTAKLNALANSKGATLFMVLQSAFALLLGRWSHQKDVVMGIPIAGRTTSEIEPLIGFFINTLVFRTELDGVTDFNSLLEIGKKTALDAYQHQGMPFDMLVEKLAPQRTLDHSPLIQITFTMQNNEEASGEGGGFADLSISPIGVGVEISKFDLELSATEMGDKVLFIWRYAEDLFHENTMRRLSDSFNRMLEGIGDNPAMAVDKLALLADNRSDELRQLAEGKTSDQMRDKPLIAHIRDMARSCPDKIAIVMGDKSVTYGEVNDKANRLADYLIEEEIGNGDLVGICCERMPAMIIAMIGVMKAGAGYVPMDVHNTPERLGHVLENAEIELVLCCSYGMEQMGVADVDVLLIEDALDEDWLGEYETAEPAQLPDMNDTAYVIYTSGSTGKPKGVNISHLGLIDYAAFALNNYYADSLDGSMVVTAHCFDLTIPSLYVPLLAGNVVNLLDDDDNISGMARVLSEPDAGNYLLRVTPMHVKGCLTLMGEDSGPLPQQHVFVVGGEAFSEEVAGAMQAKFPNAQIYNHYGPSEAVVGCCIYDYTAAGHGVNVQVPIGRPMENTLLYVLDEHLNVVEQGMVGELYIGGPCVAKGYNNQPELTEQRFIASPFGDGRRLYRSGDLVRYLEDGNIGYIGRVDDQVKVRGYRIELGEIESVIGGHEAVKDKVVLTFGEEDNKQIVAYVVLQDAFEAANVQPALKQLCTDNLPDYMIPAAWVDLPDMPLTVNGKLDKRALPAPDMLGSQVEYIAPETDTERTMVQIWAGLLKLDPEKLSTAAHFFELGGHSLLSVRLIAEVREHLKAELTVKKIFEAPVLKAMCAVVDDGGDAILRKVVTAVEREGRDLPLAFPQQWLWYMDRLQGATPEYNMPSAYRITGKVNLDAVNAAVTDIIERHEILRTVYHDAGEGHATQQIRDQFEFKVTVHDLTNMADNDKARRLRYLVEEDTQQSFDLENDLMVRAGYVLLDNEGHGQPQQGVLLFNMHHIVSDGWSMDVLTREFFVFYRAHIEGKPNPLPPLDIQYADYACWQREWLQEAVLEGQLDYWQQKLEDAPLVHSLILDKTRPVVKQHAGDVVHGRLPAETAAKLEQLQKRFNLTPFMLLHGALALVLARHSHSHDILIGTPVANRMQVELEPLVGFFANTLVLRVNTDHGALADYFDHIRTTHLDAQSNQEVPFELLVQRLNIQRSTAHTPLFQIMMTTQTDFALEESAQVEAGFAADIDIHNYSAEIATAKFDLNIDIRLTPEGVFIAWNYDVALFSARHVEQFNAHLCRLLEGLAELGDNDSPAMAELPMLSAAERDHLLHDINDTDCPYSAGLCLHHQLEAQVAATPDATAIVYGDERLSYDEFNRRANRLAHHLQQQYKVTEDTMVALCVERSIDMVVAVWAILKAGGAYVPLDIQYSPAVILKRVKVIEPALVICKGDAVQLLGDSGIELLDLGDDSVSGAIAQYDDANTDSGAGPLSLGYVLTTSGSTGEPKLIGMPHRPLVNLIEGMRGDCEKIDGQHSVLQYASIGFDMSFTDMSLALLQGGQLNLISEDHQFDVAALAQYMGEVKVTLSNLPYAMLQTLAAYSNRENINFDDLQVIISTAERLLITPEISQFFKRHPHITLVNHFGPSETHVCTSYVMPDDVEQWATMPPIGKPVQNVTCYILSGPDMLAPKGAAGELYIGGVGLARGYLDQDKLTAERFIPDPYSSDPDARLYNTGDVVRMLEDGNLDYIGRADNQIKIRGFRIEIGAIESALADNAKVKDNCVVFDRPREALIAYVNPADTSLTSSELTDYLGGEVPGYMMPAVFMLVNEWPLNANGKVDRKALPKPDASLLQGEFCAPQTETEKALADIWSVVLTMDAAKISATANFFDIGGHSLLLINLAQLINRQLKPKAPISVRALLENQQLNVQAQIIDGQLAHFDEVLVLEDLGHFNPRLPNVYWVPGVAGLARTFGDVANQASGLFNVRAFNHRGVLDGSEPFDSVAQNVDAFLTALMEVQPEGPYYLAGHSYGGVLALEMAKVLKGQGLEVRLVLIDSYFRQHELVVDDTMHPADHRDDSKRIANADTSALEHTEDLALAEAVEAVYQCQLKLFSEYMPADAQGLRTLFLHAVNSQLYSADYMDGLAELFGAMPADVPVEGDHFSMLDGLGSVRIAKSVAGFINDLVS